MEAMKIGGVPAAVYGPEAERAYLFVHGKSGCKEEAQAFAPIAEKKGWQVLSVDLPGHGERGAESDRFTPWEAAPELREVARAMRRRWPIIGLRANSIGAWFSMLALQDEPLENCLFVSPLLSMERLIGAMMGWAGVTEDELMRRGEIPTDFGETLSWRYLEYARTHAIHKWDAPTAILYAGTDALTSRATAEEFSRAFHCRLTVMEDGEHWFHTPRQLEVLRGWEEENA